MDDGEDDGGYLVFDTRFRKCPDEPHVLDWTVDHIVATRKTIRGSF